MFEMAAPIQSSAKCEVRSVVKFLNAKGERLAEIQEQIIAVNGNVMNRQNVTKWCREFSEGRIDVHDEVQERVMTWFKGRRQTSMAQGYRSCFQDLINVWTVPATMFQTSLV